MPLNVRSPSGHPGSRHALQGKWGWFVTFGVLTALLGLAALVLTETATIASVLTIGIFMILAGAVEIAIGFKARGWGQVLFWELAGVLYVLAGIFAVTDPVPASLVITLLLGAGLLATGIVRVVLGLRMQRSPTRTPLIVAGAVTALLGLVIVLGWPSNSVLVLGTLLGIDLLFSGLGWTMLGLRIRAAA